MKIEKLTISSLLKTMISIAMRRKDRDFVPSRLKSHRRVDDQTLCAANAQIRMEEDDTPLLRVLGWIGGIISVDNG